MAFIAAWKVDGVLQSRKGIPRYSVATECGKLFCEYHRGGHEFDGILLEGPTW